MLTAVILSTIAILLAIPATLLLVSFARELSALRGQIEAYQNKETRHFKDASTRLDRLEKLDDVKHKRITRLEESLKSKSGEGRIKARSSLEGITRLEEFIKPKSGVRKPKAKNEQDGQAETTK